ncbi:hypothetical protein EVAR_56166_1 [Eumeta japonica]|uniref:Uncharacterized protein n=1 Tax=Eumeta variegata TaxID=151549 RepID=A0A4C1Y7F0_EUMVA|nr:hypothetical protein EVAR_56166_1 [Eumeta japonica]
MELRLEAHIPLTNSSDVFQICSSTSGIVKYDITEIDQMQKESSFIKQLARLVSSAFALRRVDRGLRGEAQANGSSQDPTSSLVVQNRLAFPVSQERLLSLRARLSVPSIVFSAFAGAHVDEGSVSATRRRRPGRKLSRDPPGPALIAAPPARAAPPYYCRFISR